MAVVVPWAEKRMEPMAAHRAECVCLLCAPFSGGDVTVPSVLCAAVFTGIVYYDECVVK